MYKRSIPTLALLAATSGCFEDAGDLTDVLPDDRIQVNLPTGSTMDKSGSEGEWATFYLATAEVTENVNGTIGTVLYWLNTITSDYRPSYVDPEQNSAIWGPWSEGALDPVQSQLWVDYDPATDMYAWGLDRWPRSGSQDEASTVVAGEVDAGATQDVSSGRFHIDFDTINELDPTEEQIGQFSVDYDIREDGVSAQATFSSFTGEDVEDVDATYVYDQTYAGDGSMDLLMVYDLIPESSLDETLSIRSRWKHSGAGRSDVIITEGDLASQQATASECWDETFRRVYYEDNFSGESEGDPSACVFPEPSFTE